MPSTTSGANSPSPWSNGRPGRVYLARDPVGVKPLYWSERGGRLHIASEVKSLVPVGTAVTEVPPGHHGWGGPGSSPQLAPYVDLMRLGEDEDPIEDPDEATKLVRSALEDSIRVRVDTDLTVGVILSGGVDERADPAPCPGHASRLCRLHRRHLRQR